MKRSKLLIQCIALMLMSDIANAALTVQVVDDSMDDNGNSLNPYFLMAGKPGPSSTTGAPVISPSAVPVVNLNSPASTAPTLVSSLGPAAGTTVSSYTGRVLPVYQFTVSSISSGLFMPFYGNTPQGSPPFTWQSAAPSPITSNFRFDQLELTFDPTIQSAIDLTSIDAYSIPMQIDVMAPQTQISTQTATYYLSSESIVNQALNANLGTAIDLINPTTGGNPTAWSKGTPITLSNFARIISPGQSVASSASGSPAPFPSFYSYLNSLPLNAPLFSLGGSAFAQPYFYNATLAGDGAKGFTLTLTGTTSTTATAICPSDPSCKAGDTLVVYLFNASNPSPPNGLLPAYNMDATIYGAGLNTYSVNGSMVCGNGAQPNCNTNTLDGAIVRDALASLNFGYVGGCTGKTSSVDWFGAAPLYNPFGMARPPCATTAAGHPNGNLNNDGYYNPWAAFFYNESDAYANAFSDRNNAQSPKITLQNNQTVRITILPDRRLDAPFVTATSSIVGGGQGCSIGLNWSPIANATGYSISVNPGGYTFNNGSQTSTSIYALSCGTPYTVQVAATGVSKFNNNPISSPARNLQVVTPGSATALTGSINFQGGFSFAQTSVQNIPSTASVSIGGQTLTYNSTTFQWLNNGVPAQLSANSGLNQYVVTLNEPNSFVSNSQTYYPSMQLFSGILSANFTGSSNSYNVNTAWLSGNANVSNGGAITFAPPNGPYTGSPPVTLGVPFVPVNYPKVNTFVNFNPQ